MLIGQLSDIHIGFDRQPDSDKNPEQNLVRLRAALALGAGPRTTALAGELLADA